MPNPPRTPRKRKSTPSRKASTKRTKMSYAPRLYSELKKAQNHTFVNQNIINPRVYNANYFLSEGVKRYQVVATGLLLKSFYLRWNVQMLTTANSGFGDATMRISLIFSTERYTNTNTALASPSDIFRNDGNASANYFATTAHFDKDKVKLLYDQQFTITGPALTNQPKVKSGEIIVPINKIHHTTADNTGVFKDGQYFWVVSFSRPGDDSTTSPYVVALQWSLNYKDS